MTRSSNQGQSRLLEKKPNLSRFRYCVKREQNQAPQLLAATRPEKAVIGYDELLEVVEAYQGERVSYHNGMVNSSHTPPVGA